MFYNVGGVLAAASISKREVCKYMYFQFYTVMLKKLTGVNVLSYF